MQPAAPSPLVTGALASLGLLQGAGKATLSGPCEAETVRRRDHGAVYGEGGVTLAAIAVTSTMAAALRDRITAEYAATLESFSNLVRSLSVQEEGARGGGQVLKACSRN